MRSDTKTIDPIWSLGGHANNAVQRVTVTVVPDS